MSDELDEVIGEFLVESHENLDQLDQELVALEQETDREVLAQIFRTIHTIKGTSGFLGFTTLESVTHVGENLLSKLRDGELDMTTEIATTLLQMVDVVREILTAVEATGNESGQSYDDLIERLTRLDRGETLGDAVGEPVSAADQVSAEEADEADADEADEDEAAADEGKVHRLHVPSDDPAEEDDGDHEELFGEHLIAEGKVTEDDLADALRQQADGDPRRVGEILVEKAGLEPAAVSETLQSQAQHGGERVAGTMTGETIRVDVGLLDDLMNFVGELVLARNQILQFTDALDDSQFLATTQRLNLITSELQESVMKTRMQPIENVWNKFPRVVRDLTVSVGKSARLEMEGKHTELDKTLLEAIKDPLTHLVRNAVDHGLETVEDRERAGKPGEGVVRLRAYHEGGQVVVEIADDGAGIDPNKIRAKVVEKGMLTADDAAVRSDRDIINYIFAPGFSTAAEVTNISGRGVGMDVVKTNIEGIGGSVDVQSRMGVGTTFTVKIPLTLAIIPALVVTCDDNQYAVPQVNLLELVRVDEAERIESIDGQRLYRLRGQLLPLIDLAEVFGHDGRSAERDVHNIVVLQADDRVFGLVVDEINDTNEIVVKPLGRLLQQVNVYAGATIMGDGHVALILDVFGLAQQVGLASDMEDLERQSTTGSSGAASEQSGELRELLVVRLADRRFALPLSAVSRLESFDPEQIEIANHRAVVQYGDDIMPLVQLGDELGAGSYLDDSQPRPVIVVQRHGSNAGLIVDEILDIVSEHVPAADDHQSGFGLLGSLVIHSKVTDLIDIEGVLMGVLPDHYHEGVAA